MNAPEPSVVSSVSIESESVSTTVTVAPDWAAPPVSRTVPSIVMAAATEAGASVVAESDVLGGEIDDPPADIDGAGVVVASDAIGGAIDDAPLVRPGGGVEVVSDAIGGEIDDPPADSPGVGVDVVSVETGTAMDSGLLVSDVSRA